MTPELHDFTKPGSLPAEWQNRISAWLHLAIGLAGKAWAKELPALIEASLVKVETCWANVGLAKLSDTMIGYHVLIAGQRLPTFLVFPRATLIKIVGVLLGDFEGEPKDRELTVVEEKLADYFIGHAWLKYFRETWLSNEVVSWTLAESESNPQCSRIFSPDEALVCTHWRIKGPWGESDSYWLWPKKKLIDLADCDTGAVNVDITPEVVSARREGLVHALPMLLEVDLGTADLKLSELSNLRVGDVIVLDQRLEDEVVARMGSRSLFRGRPGRMGTRIALRIDSTEES